METFIAKIIGVGTYGTKALEVISASGIQGATFLTLEGREEKDSIESLIGDASMVFIVATAADIDALKTAFFISEIARKFESITIAFVASDTSGKKSKPNNALSYFDATILIENEASIKTDPNIVDIELISISIASITESITANGMVNLDYGDVAKHFSNAGMVQQVTTRSSGMNRARVATQQAIANLSQSELSIKLARRLLINVTSSSAIKLTEIDSILELFDRENDTTQIILSAITDETMGNDLRLTLFAT